MCPTGRFDGTSFQGSNCALPDSKDEFIASYSESVAKLLRSEMSSDEFKPARVINGIYEQRDDGKYMMRLRIVASKISCDQLRLVSCVAKRHNAEHIHLTSRQTIQIHGIQVADTPEMMGIFADAGLGMMGGGGDGVRNIAVSPFSGTSPCELFDTAPYAVEMTRFLLNQKESYKLPRKFKIAFAGSDMDFEPVSIADIGFLAAVENGEPGFRVYGGGGLGAKPRMADLVLPWIPCKDCIRAAEAMRRFFHANGDRKNRSAARLRFVFERIGKDAAISAFREIYSECVEEGVPECRIVPLINPNPIRPDSPSHLPDFFEGLAFWTQRDNNLVSVRMAVPFGIISPDDAEKLADIAGQFSENADLRTSQKQDFILKNVRIERLSQLSRSLESLEIDRLRRSPSVSMTVCTGASVCRLGACDSRSTAMECSKALESAGIPREIIEDADIRISGCPNNCARHSLAGIGFSGIVKNIDGHRVPFYKCFINFGASYPRTELNSEIGVIPADSLPDFLLRLLSTFVSERMPEELLSTFIQRQGKQRICDMLSEFSATQRCD